MKILIFTLVLLTLCFADNSKYQKIVADFTRAITTGDKKYLEDNIHPTAVWSAPFQKLLRGRNEIVQNHNGIAEGHEVVTTDLEFIHNGKILQVFGFFNYLQQQEVSHSGRFIGTFEENTDKVFQLTNGLWQLDGSHLPKTE